MASSNRYESKVLIYLRMSSCVAALLILITTVSQIKADNVSASTIDDVVEVCRTITEEFVKVEPLYSAGLPGPFEPLISGPPAPPEIVERAYDKEIRQRPFECITDQLPGVSEDQLRSSPAYKDLVEQCKSRQEHPKCESSSKEYRTIDGTCNNLKNPSWGSTLCCAPRLFDANYVSASGIRKSVVDGKELPNARYISRVLHTDVKRPSTNLSALGVIFAQAVSHEMTDYAFVFVNGTEIQCCKNPEGLGPHPQCAPIFVDDEFYAKHNVTCLNTYRKAMCDTCKTGKRVPSNQPTSFIDLSLAYGYGYQDLRENGTGKMRVQHTDKAGDLLPPRPEYGDACGNVSKNEYCILAGDRRCNQQTPLTIMHTLFVLEHNRIYNELQKLNPSWTEEKLFQEARKINIAQMQVMVYQELLPLLLGDDLMCKYNLKLDSVSQYNPDCDACILVEFNVAAYRGHYFIPGDFIFNAKGVSNSTRLRHMFGNSVPLYENEASSYLKQMSCHYAGKYGRHMTIEIKNYLYKNLRGDWGYDLTAFDYQRGRDNGVPTYVQMIRYLYGENKNITSFDDLNRHLIPECVEIMKKIYADPRDIDLFAGITCERRRGDALIGPMAAKLIAMQFNRTKVCDRFFFTHDDSLSDEQKKELMKASLAKMICDNTNVTSMHPEAMKLPDCNICWPLPLPCTVNNFHVSCDLIPGVNLSLWKE